MSEVKDLRLMLDAHQPVIVIETRDEGRLVKAISELALQRSTQVVQWTCTDGLQSIGFGTDPGGGESNQYADPEDALEHIKKDKPGGGIYLLCDIDPYFERSPKPARLIKDLALAYERHEKTLVLIGREVDLPKSIRHFCVRLDVQMPNEDQLLNIVREEARRWRQENNAEKVSTEREALTQLVNNLKGLSFDEARRLARQAIARDGAITKDDLPEVNRAKFELMGMEGVLTYEHDTARFAEVGGLSRLKCWIDQRREAFYQTNEKTQLSPPKGVMLLGVQGSGKSLAAKAVAGLWQAPLLRLDFGSLFNKYIGESEKNMREALGLAQTMAPCVLWMDEIEKGMGQGGEDDGTSKRMLGTLLTWMAENESSVFIVATSNDVSQLPPELLRKGRLDEIFFVDLPESNVRRDIFGIHLEKRDLDPADLDVDALVAESEGFSGAEIEQAIVAALYHAHAEDQPVTTELLMEQLRDTSPLSVIKGEEIERLRHWAEERAVSAN